MDLSLQEVRAQIGAWRQVRSSPNPTEEAAHEAAVAITFLLTLADQLVREHQGLPDIDALVDQHDAIDRWRPSFKVRACEKQAILADLYDLAAELRGSEARAIRE